MCIFLVFLYVRGGCDDMCELFGFFRFVVCELSMMLFVGCCGDDLCE